MISPSLVILLFSTCAQESPGTPEPEPDSIDRFEIVIAPAIRRELQEAGSAARLVILLDDETGDGSEGGEPSPSLLAPQPVLSWSLEESTPAWSPDGTGLSVLGPGLAWPVPADDLDGRFRAMAVVKLPGTPPGLGAVGDLLGPVTMIDLDSSRTDRPRLELDRIVEPPKSPTHPDLIPIERPSSRLPAVDGVPGRHRAWVVLPDGYDDIRNPRRYWPVTYVIPDREPPEVVALRLATLAERAELKDIIPNCLWVVVDPMGRWGHHYCIDSETNGDRGTALVEELIPWLDVRFRTIPEPEARLVMGRGAGGRAALELLSRHPERFGRCWSISPDAIGFDHLGLLDLYRDEDAFVEEGGRLRPAARTPLGPERDLIHARLRDEIQLTRTLDPDGRSGWIWDARRAAFGDNGARPSLPPLPFDPDTGRIDLLVASDWSVRDLLARTRRSAELRTLLLERALVLVGERDEYYREQGVLALADVLGVDPSERGSSVRIIPEATAGTVSALGRMDVYDGISAYLEERGLQD